LDSERVEVKIMVNIDELDKILGLLNKHDVDTVGFDGDGNIIQLVFKRFPTAPGFTVEQLPPPQAQPIAVNVSVEPAEPRETLEDLALHPPKDVLYPVDDGKP